MQNNIVMAFRKRLKKRGYLNISIHKALDENNYSINAIEPLSGGKVFVIRSLCWLANNFR